ncbi:uncharacterized mitochondrial protein AtMg00810-like [Pyrus x bretschneideri]|uniref:uncharacterized mitochondrial protein AtMg00810-like n=1 Tax=Pyrus x bretschneideri TaxID=225117 RepID=UPI00202E0898|nr:uncharacterized mitochondrial protein AtMg00810-like [Pyrus x bretschneideri]
MSDTSLFVKVDGSDVIVLLLYVDDIILTGSNTEKIQFVIDNLADVFDLKDMGTLAYFLGLQVQYNGDGSLFVNQSKYTKELVKEARMEHCKSTSTPSKPHSQLLTIEGTPLSDPTHYRSLVGALQYLTFTRPDIAHSVNVINAYSDSNWVADINTRRSITGYVVYVSSNPISWQSKKQETVSRSSTEAEYKALAHCAADVFWI